MTVPAGGERRPPQAISEGLLPRVLYRYEIELDRVLDLTDGKVRARVGLGADVLTGVGDVLAVFVQHIGRGRLEPKLVEEWRSLDQLDGWAPRPRSISTFELAT